MFFGLEMGTGMRTYSPTILPHLLVLAVFALGSSIGAVGAALGFATGRALMIPMFHRQEARKGATRFSFRVPLVVENAAAALWPALPLDRFRWYPA